MWTTILFNIAISIVIIIIANHIWEYCKINYTSQKTKNLIEIHASKYKQIAEDIGFADCTEGSKSEIFRRCDSGASNENRKSNTERSSILPVNPPKFLREDEKEWIQTELTAFLKEI
jgi:hypothetical protein